MTSDPRDRLWERLAGVVVFWTLAILPFRLIALGWRPRDDAMRHVAKVLSGRPWSDILVLRPEVTVDPAAGWHALLGLAHRLGVSSGVGLLVVSVFVGAALYLLTPLLFVRRPAAWALTLTIVALVAPLFWRRLMFGRPYLVSMTVLSVLAWIWPRFDEERWPRVPWIAFAGLMALATWMHGSWYLFALPLGCFVLSFRLRAAARIGTAMAVGIVVGAVATGAPLAFLWQTAMHPIWSLSTRFPQNVLVNEFQPSGGAAATVAVVVAWIAWRRVRQQPLTRPLATDPVFVLACVGWALGLHTLRFWYDWGLPAALVWLTRELEASWPPPDEAKPGMNVRRSLLLTASIAIVLFLVVTADTRAQWSGARDRAFLHAENSSQAPWLPEPGGILYSNSMHIFYEQFFANPRAPWRYMVGFEPALMPPRDLKIFRRMQVEGLSDDSLRPWIDRMRREDRFVLERPGGGAPELPRLEWHSPYRGMWIGRLPRSESDPAVGPAESESHRG